MTPWIQNVALSDIPKGFHFDPGINAMLIQIVDPCMEFPEPKYQFRERHQFEFLDLEEKDSWGEEFKITDEQAETIAKLLQHALDERMNVVVHCVAGVCRSGAVCEVGVMMGFRDTEVYRSPNLMVKHKLMKVLGWTYDENEPMTENGRPFWYDDLNNKHYVDEDGPEVMMFAVYYEAGAGVCDSGVDYALFRAEDEDHAREKFQQHYPEVKITSVECRGSAY